MKNFIKKFDVKKSDDSLEQSWGMLTVSAFSLSIAILFFTSVIFRHSETSAAENNTGRLQDDPVVEEVTLDITETAETDDSAAVDNSVLRDESTIYSFLQGPVAWQNRYNWSGYWGQMMMEDGSYFGSFSCGLCCIANIYDTLSPYEASPVDIYDYAKENTSYYPTAENGAIGWGDALRTLEQLGMTADIARKPADIETFQTELENSQTAMILVMSSDPDSYWGETPGHYVNIWNYNSQDQTVFVANPGANSKNRKTISVQECYDYLKDVSNYQVIYVRSYDESQDQWKRAENASGDWTRPDYMPAKY